jgi:hypothetical protein
LHVKDAGYRQGIVLERSGSSTSRGFIYIGDNTNSTLVDEIYIDAVNTNIHFRQGPTGTTETVVFTSSGRVGIGTTTSPEATLDLSGSFIQRNPSGNVSYSTVPVGVGRLSTIALRTTDGSSVLRDGLVLEAGIPVPGVRGGIIKTTDANAPALTLQTATSSSALISFNVNNAERARIDSAGRLLVGTSSSLQANSLLQVYKASGSAYSYVEVDSLANGDEAGFYAAGGNRDLSLIIRKHSGITNPVAYLQLMAEDGARNYYWTDNSDILRISTNAAHVGTTSGTVVGAQTSDERIKNILGPVEYGLAEIKQLDPVSYALKSDPEQVPHLGFIAQQVNPIIPESVFDTDDHIEGEPEDAPTKLGMEYVALIPVLVNAIKELSAEVDALKAQLQAS